MSRFQDLFISTSRDHISLIKQLLEQQKAVHGDQMLITELHLHFHSLKSEAFTMGYKLCGAYLTVIEKYLKSFKDSNSFPGENQVDILILAVKDIENTLEKITVNQKEPADLAEKQVLLQKQLGISINL